MLDSPPALISESARDLIACEQVMVSGKGRMPAVRHGEVRECLLPGPGPAAGQSTIAA